MGLPEKKENNTPALARKIQQKLYREKHIGGVDVTGDPAGLQRSTTNEDGTNNYTIITETLGKGVLKPKIKLLKSSLHKLPDVNLSMRCSRDLTDGN